MFEDMFSSKDEKTVSDILSLDEKQSDEWNTGKPDDRWSTNFDDIWNTEN